ncbi:hypothetical protein IC582_000421 [Cucumis melo]
MVSLDYDNGSSHDCHCQSYSWTIHTSESKHLQEISSYNHYKQSNPNSPLTVPLTHQHKIFRKRPETACLYAHVWESSKQYLSQLQACCILWCLRSHDTSLSDIQWGCFEKFFPACGDLGLCEMEMEIHCQVEVCVWDSDNVNNSLVAKKMFDKMPVSDLTSWNTMISGYVRNNNAMEALTIMYLTGKSELKADGTTLLALLTSLAAIKQGKEIHCYAVRNNYCTLNDFLMNSLIDMYSNCSSVAAARQLFEELKTKDTVSWNSIISCYQHSGDAFESLRLFYQTLIEDTAASDEITIVSVLGACEKITALQFGKSKNMVAWSAMIAAYGIHGRGKEAVSLQLNDGKWH